MQVACAAAVCTWKVGNGNIEKSESWAQRTRGHMQGIKNKYCSFAASQLDERCFHYLSVSFSKKSHCQILVSFHFKSGTCPSFLRPLWNQRRQGQSTEGQKLGFFPLLSLRFTTVREFPTSHWCLMPYVTAGNCAVALCLLVLTSYQSPDEHLQHLQGQLCFWRGRATILPQDTQSTPVPHYLVSASPLPAQKIEMMFPFSPLLCVPCPCPISCLERELSAVVVTDLLNK